MGIFRKIRVLLSASERKATWILLSLMLVGMVLETLSIGLVIPSLSLMMQDDTYAQYPAIQHLFKSMGNPDKPKVITIAMLALVGIYLVKNLFMAFLAWRQTKFSYGVQVNLSQRLFTFYLRQPYTFHLQRNSAQLLRNVGGEVNVFTNAITSSLMILAESFVLFGIAVLMMLIEPLGAAIVVMVVGSSAFVYHRSTKKRITKWGVARQFHERLRIQHLQQGLGGAKDVKLLGRESDFLGQYYLHNMASAQVGKLQATLQQMPRLFLELLAVTGLAILVISMLGQGREIASIVPTLGLFAAAAFRLMPSVNRILSAIQTMRFAMPAVDTLHQELSLAEPEIIKKSTGTVVFKNEIALKDITYIYPNSNTEAVNCLSLTIHKGRSIGLIGASGSGKSTLVDIILGLLSPETGLILIDGEDMQKNLRQWQDQIGYVPQSIYLTDDTLRRNVAFGLADDQIDNAAVHRAIKAAQLEEFVLGLPDQYEAVVGERGIRLSGGQRQRIGIARALYHDPSLLVLDEATSALDTATEEGVMQAINALQGTKTIIIVAHRLSTVEYCDQIYRMEHGKIVQQGSPVEVLKSTKIIAAA
ncbi:MAG TPA: ABC transporter ATP-binding protein [Methylophilaceae bacterium]|nr:ABC transporter ATP-binding protein [Methylophilaceae bacterium]